MKLFTLCLMLFLFTGFCACENHMDIRDVVKGTPSKADTVMPHKFPLYKKADSSKPASVARVFRR